MWLASICDPPNNAVVVCVDEKSQIQALDRTQPILPMRPGLPERQTHDYKRHGTTTLFAALEIATGTGRRRLQSAPPPPGVPARSSKQVASAYPGVQLHVVCDNYATHKHPTVRAWLAKNPRITLHFTPTSCSWLNLVECFFSIITRQAIRRGTYTSVADLTAHDRGLHRSLERPPPAVHLDQARRGNPRQDPPRED